MTEDAITDVNLLRELNLNFKIEVVTDSNLSAYIGESKSKRILNSKFKGVDSYLSSRIKTEILSTYGGIWLDRVYHYDDPILYVDSPCKVFTSLNNKHETFPYVVCKSSHPYIKRWSEIVKSIEDYNEIEDFLKIVNEKYLKGLTDDKAEIKNFIGEITARIALENFDIRVYRDSLAIMDRGEPIEEEEEYEIRLIKRDKPVSEIEDSNNSKILFS